MIMVAIPVLLLVVLAGLLFQMGARSQSRLVLVGTMAATLVGAAGLSGLVSKGLALVVIAFLGFGMLALVVRTLVRSRPAQLQAGIDDITYLRVEHRVQGGFNVVVEQSGDHIHVEHVRHNPERSW